MRIKSWTKLLAAAFVAAGLLTGCLPSQPEKEENSVYVDPRFDGAPKWVMSPDVEGTISSLGSAKRNSANDFAFQRAEAKANARDNLATQIEVKVSNMFKSYKGSTGSGEDGTFDKSVESVSKQIASQTLSGTRVHDTWINKQGTLFVLMVVDTDSVADMMEKQLKTSFKNDEAMYQQFRAQKAQGELEKELEKNEQ